MTNYLMAFRVGVRAALRQPFNTITVVAFLALGISLTTTVFSIVHGVLFRPLPYESPERLVCLTPGRVSFRAANWNPAVQPALESVASFEQVEPLRPSIFSVSGATSAETIRGAQAPPGLFELLGVGPLLGSVYSAQDPPQEVAVIAYSFWQSHFGGSESVIGQTIRVDGQPRSIVAVMPQSFDFYRLVELWVPFTQSDIQDASGPVSIFARLAADASIQRARSEVQTLAAPLQRLDLLEEGQEIQVRPLDEERGANGVGPMAVFLLICSVGVFLVVCANLVNLYLARLVHRRQEIALRFALGGGRARFGLQLIFENLPVMLVSTFLAVSATYWTIHFVSSLATPTLPAWMEFRLSWPVLVFSAALVFFVLLLASIVPAARLSSPNLQQELKESGLQVSGGVRVSRWQGACAGIQMALAMILLVVSSLILRSSNRMRNFVAELPGNTVIEGQAFFTDSDRDYRNEYYESLRQRSEAHPAVKRVAGEWRIDLELSSGALLEAVAGRTIRAGAVDVQAVDKEFFDALGMRLAEGRGIDSQDAEGTPRVAVVNRKLGEMLWPREPSVLGRRFKLGEEDFTVVGVLENQQRLRTRRFSVLTAPQPALYLSGPQVGSEVSGIYVQLRSEDAKSEVIQHMTQLSRSMDADLPLEFFPAQEGLLAQIYSWLGRILGGLGMVSTLVALLGVYALISFQAQRREKEIGIRSALGASRRQIRRLVLRHTLRMVLPGIIAGGVIAGFFSTLMSEALFGVSPLALWLYAGVAALLAGLSLVAALYPAVRASRVDPADFLRAV